MVRLNDACALYKHTCNAPVSSGSLAARESPGHTYIGKYACYEQRVIVLHVSHSSNPGQSANHGKPTLNSGLSASLLACATRTWNSWDVMLYSKAVSCFARTLDCGSCSVLTPGTPSLDSVLMTIEISSRSLCSPSRSDVAVDLASLVSTDNLQPSVRRFRTVGPSAGRERDHLRLHRVEACTLHPALHLQGSSRVFVRLHAVQISSRPPSKCVIWPCQMSAAAPKRGRGETHSVSVYHCPIAR